MSVIKSAQNSRFKNLLKLKKNRSRRQESLVWVEGLRPLERYLYGRHGDNHIKVLCLLEGELERWQDDEEKKKLLNAEEVLSLDVQLMKKLSNRENPPSSIALVQFPFLTLKDLEPLSQNSLFVIVDDMEKPGNLGAILRIADGAGVDAVILCEKVDPTHPSVVQNSMGSLFTQKVIKTDLEELIPWLHENEISIFSAMPGACHLYHEVNLTGKCAIVLGREDCGLRSSWMKQTRWMQSIGIPMLGIADSLNVSCAAAVILYEAQRQRSAGKKK